MIDIRNNPTEYSIMSFGSNKTHKRRDRRKRAKARMQQLVEEQQHKLGLLPNKSCSSTPTAIPYIRSLTDFPRIVDIIDHRRTSSSSQNVVTIDTSDTRILGSFLNSPLPAALSSPNIVENNSQSITPINSQIEERVAIIIANRVDIVDSNSSNNTSTPRTSIIHSTKTSDVVQGIINSTNTSDYQQGGILIGKVTSDEENDDSSPTVDSRETLENVQKLQQQQHNRRSSSVPTVVINTLGTTATIKIYKKKENSEEKRQQHDASDTRGGVSCSTITISLDTDDDFFGEGGGNNNKSIKIDDNLLEDFINSGADIGVNEIFKLCKWE